MAQKGTSTPSRLERRLTIVNEALADGRPQKPTGDLVVDKRLVDRSYERVRRRLHPVVREADRRVGHEDDPGEVRRG
jgi:hypothetical protein